MKKVFILLTLLFILTGCWDYKELNNYSIVTGIAIDKDENDKYEVSVLISNSPKDSSSTKESSESNVVVYTGKSSTIFGAFKDIGLISPKEIYIGSFSVLIISEDIAKEGLNEIVDVFLRYPNSRKSFYITITKGDKAKDVLKIMTPLANYPSQNISDNLSSSTDLQGIIGKVTFNELLSIFVNDGIDPAINTIHIVGSEKKGENQSNLKTTEPNTYVKLGTLSIFKNYKLVKHTTYEESMGINFVNNKVDETYLKIKHNDGYVVVDTTDFKSDIKVLLNNNEPKVNINISGSAKIIESSKNINLEDIKIIKEIQNKTNKRVKKIINNSIEAAKEYESDIFGFGLKFSREYPNFFKANEWKDIFNDLDVSIKSNLVIRNEVSSRNSLEEINDKG